MGPVRPIACCCGSGQGGGLLSLAMHLGTCLNAEAAGTSRHKTSKIVSMLEHSEGALTLLHNRRMTPCVCAFCDWFPGCVWVSWTNIPAL